MDNMRFIYGAVYPSFLCYTSIIIKGIAFVSTVIILSIESIFHYRFITFKSQFPIIQDDLLIRICWRITFAISTSFVLVRLYLPGRMPVNYYLCTGLDPNEGKGYGAYQKEPKKSAFDAYLLYFICLVYFCHSVMIVYQQVKIDIRAHQQQAKLMSGLVNGLNDTLYRRNLKDIFMLMAKMSLWVYCMVVIGKINSANPEELQTYPGLFHVIVLHQIMNPCMVWAVTIMHYAKNQGLQSFAKRKIVSWWQDFLFHFNTLKQRIPI